MPDDQRNLTLTVGTDDELNAAIPNITAIVKTANESGTNVDYATRFLPTDLTRLGVRGMQTPAKQLVTSAIEHERYLRILLSA